jgi:hypothetical protein
MNCLSDRDFVFLLGFAQIAVGQRGRRVARVQVGWMNALSLDEAGFDKPSVGLAA